MAEHSLVKILLPKLGESIVSATVVQWLKKEGDYIALDEPLVEVSTDKVNSEIPSPFTGILKEILVKVDQEVEVGKPIALIDSAQGSSNQDKITSSLVTPCPLMTSTGKETVFTPAVLRIARQEGLTIEQLNQIQGSGEGGRVTKLDLENYLQARSSKPIEPPKPSFQGADEEFSFPTEERVQMTGLRKAIAENMVRSFYEAPHASLVAEIDVTDTMNLIAKEKERFFKAHGVKLTITTFLIQALAKAVSQFPMLNASLENETIIMKKYINVGMAVNVEKGLIVPVIKHCQDRNLISIAKSVGELAQKARNGKLVQTDVNEGTITLTNFGMTGALIGVPIIRYPEVAIIGAGTVQKRVVVKEDDSFAIRKMMYVTLTFDHRVLDGIYGCEFLEAFKQYLESPSFH